MTNPVFTRNGSVYEIIASNNGIYYGWVNHDREGCTWDIATGKCLDHSDAQDLVYNMAVVKQIVYLYSHGRISASRMGIPIASQCVEFTIGKFADE